MVKMVNFMLCEFYLNLKNELEFATTLVDGNLKLQLS